LPLEDFFIGFVETEQDFLQGSNIIGNGSSEGQEEEDCTSN